MSGTRAGGLKCAATNRLKHGDDFYNRIGSQGGKVKNPNKGFGSNHERAVAVGRKGRTQRDLTNAQKQHLSYHEGARAAILQISYMIDQLITESCKYRENDKLWRLRDKVLTLQQLANVQIKEIKK